MRCPKCNQPLPDDSEFCQFCGVDIVEFQKAKTQVDLENGTKASSPDPISKSTEQVYQNAKIQSNRSFEAQDNNNHDLLQNKTKPKSKKYGSTRYCKKCGGKIDDIRKVCSSCGKQYFSFKKALPTMLLLFLSVILIGLNITQLFVHLNDKAKIEELDNTVKERNITISSQKSTISSNKTKITNLENEVSDLESQLSEVRSNSFEQWWKLYFYEEHVVVVPDDGTNLYHTYGCDYLDTSSFWVYNTEAAVNLGYNPCRYCQ